MSQGDAKIDREISISAGATHTVQPASGEVWRLERMGQAGSGFQIGGGELVIPEYYDGTTASKIMRSNKKTSTNANYAGKLNGAYNGTAVEYNANGTQIFHNPYYLRLNNTSCSSRTGAYEGVQIK